MSKPPVIVAANAAWASILLGLSPSALSGKLAAAAILCMLTPLQSYAALLLTEIHYNGPGSGRDLDEFLELTNIGTDVFDLSGYEFTAGVDFVFPDGSSLASGESLLAVSDTIGFLAAFPSVDSFNLALVEYAGALNNSGERVALYTSTASVVFDVGYDDSAAWPQTADGLGDSLQLLPNSANGINPNAWFASTPTPGRWFNSSSPSTEEVPAPATGVLLASFLLLLVRRKYFSVI
ncbi:MAG: lamin tail domain-containing protein [Pseudomonadota bacterium]